jgi:hypothetical protein
MLATVQRTTATIAATAGAIEFAAPAAAEDSTRTELLTVLGVPAATGTL